MDTIIHTKKCFQGDIIPPADKSISHRAVMLGAIAEGTTIVENLLRSEDVLSTVGAFRALGISIQLDKNTATIEGKGLRGLHAASGPVDAGNSGTTMRLLMGILAGQQFATTITGDSSLSRRPMDRVIEPLTLMGARVEAFEKRYAPLIIHGSALDAISYRMKVASAQVKSAILLAGLYAKGDTEVIEPIASRDHTERMLTLFGGTVLKQGNVIRVSGAQTLRSCHCIVPGDISSAAFFIVGALLHAHSVLRVQKVGLNPTRQGLISVLKDMGAQITISPTNAHEAEPVGDILVQSGKRLQATVIHKAQIPLLIDELPILMVAACFAQGVTKICGAEELRVKETDRIHSMVTNLSAMGAHINVQDNDILIEGTGTLRGATVESFLDHRTAMACAIAGCAAEGETIIKESQCVSISFPDFFGLLDQLTHE